MYSTSYLTILWLVLYSYRVTPRTKIHTGMRWCAWPWPGSMAVARRDQASLVDGSQSWDRFCMDHYQARPIRQSVLPTSQDTYHPPYVHHGYSETFLSHLRPGIKPYRLSKTASPLVCTNRLPQLTGHAGSACSNRMIRHFSLCITFSPSMLSPSRILRSPLCRALSRVVRQVHGLWHDGLIRQIWPTSITRGLLRYDYV